MTQILEEEKLMARTLDMQGQPTRLLGRDADLKAIEGLLHRDETRLLTGPAGVGKTRLAVEVGRRVSGEFAQGVAFVDLSPVRDPFRVGFPR